MTENVRLILLRREIISALPDSHILIFEEYSDIIVNRLEELMNLNNQQNEVLRSLVNRNEN